MLNRMTAPKTRTLKVMDAAVVGAASSDQKLKKMMMTTNAQAKTSIGIAGNTGTMNGPHYRPLFLDVF